MSIDITISDELEKFIEDKIRSGAFSNPSDVVGNALMTVKAQEVYLPEVTPELLKEIALGVKEFERGEYARWDIQEIEEMLNKSADTHNS